jgi:hypothetical protein
MAPIDLPPPGTPYLVDWYISRPHEEQLAARYLKYGQPVLLWGPRHQGRTWLQVHLARSWKDADPANRRVVRVNFRTFGPSSLESLDACLRALADAIAETLDDGKSPPLDVTLIWEGRGDAKKKINEWMQRSVLRSIPGLLLLIIEHADIVHSRGYYEEFASLLRSWAEKAQLGAPWDRLRLVISVNTHPARLPTARHASWFAGLSPPILVGDLEREQVAELVRRHGLVWTATDLDRLMEYAGGHPYLVRAVLVDILDQRYTLAEFASGVPLGPSLITDHLREHRTRVDASSALAAAFAALAKNPSAAVEPEVLDALIRQGLVRQGVAGTHPVRYRLYERILLPDPSAVLARRKRRLFYVYAHADEALRDRLDVHLKLLERQGLIDPRHDRCIPAGAEWAREIDRRLAEADIILLLVSADFVASSYCWEIELKRALERHETGEATVVPVILRPCDWRPSAPFAKLQALPKDALPVTRWADPEDAWVDIAQGIRKLITDG